MLNQREITDLALDTLESGIEKGREALEFGIEKGREVLESGIEKGSEALGTIVPMATRMILPARPSRSSRGPLWIGLGLAVAGVSVLLSRRSRSSFAGSNGSDGADGRRLRDVMVTDVHAIAPSATVVEAAEQMYQSNVGALPIVDNDVVVGIITDRDLVVRVLARRGVSASATSVMDCATKNPVLGRADWTAQRALVVMAEKQVGRLPVVDEGGRLLGIVTLSSLALRSSKPDETLAAARKVSLRSARKTPASH